MVFLDLERGQRSVRRKLVRWGMKSKPSYIMPRLLGTSSFFVCVAQSASVGLLSDKCFTLIVEGKRHGSHKT